jgi:hypothetical protein
MGRWVWRVARVGLMATGALLLLYIVFVRPWHLRWGATETEVGRRMPGDDIVTAPDMDATRAIEIAATSAKVWPFLGQRATEVVSQGADDEGGTWVKEAEPGRWLVWSDGRGESSWSWVLYPAERGTTRLVIRQRARYPWHSPRVLRALLADAADVVPLRRCMLDIKREAETKVGPANAGPAAEGPQ